MESSNNHPLPLPPAENQGQYSQYQQHQQYQQYQPPVQQYQPPVQQHQPPVQPVQPAQPVQQEPPKPRPEPLTSKSRSFSFHSDKSQKNSASRYHETSAEKEAKRLHSKADPTLAMNEAEPAAVQATERSMLAPLRSIQHRDPFGNPIAEPDRSNPTRSRWERPLDTIRSFEAAIDGGYSRKSYARSEADWNRKSSYYGSKLYPSSRPPSVLSKHSAFAGNGPRFPQDSYYGGRPASQFDPRTSVRDSYYEGSQYGGNGAGGGSYGPGPSRQRAPRMQSEPQLSNGLPRPDQNGVYPLQHRDRSYETVTSAAGSGSSGDQGSYQTDPSSDNSSFDRNSPAKPPPVPTNDYGIGFSQTTNYQPPAFTVGPNPNGVNGDSSIQKKPVGSATNLPPPVPSKDQELQRRLAAQGQSEPPKRKSWLLRRFSKAS